MDRSWMNHNCVKDRRKPEYIAGVNEFLHFAFTGKSDETMLKCPCLNCRLVLSQNRKNMHCHLLVYGIDPTYNPWVSHGESIQEIDNDEEGYVGEVSDNESDHMPLDDMTPFRRGPTRGKKYGPRMWNSNSEEKIKINFMDELHRVVGEKADEFICDCTNWVKEYCPLDSWNWAKMDKMAKNRLYDKIRTKYDLPEKVAGADVTEVLSFQCSMLYKHWRFRLKEQHFRDKSLVDAINSRPNNIDVGPWTWLVCDYWNGEKQKHISKVNTENKLKQTETPANGARSTARIFHDLINVPPTQPTQELDGSSEPHETQQDPLYITLFEKTKKNKGSGWEPNAEKDYEALKRLHEKEVEKHGEDTLSVKDAYMEVFKQKSGYVKGLGPGARPPKKCRADGESNEARTSLSLEIQKLKDDAATREASLASEIETLKASNDELKTSNEELIVSNDELKATVSRINIEAIKREKKLRDDMMKMFEQMR
ncbi:Fibronectin-binding protein PlpA [Bienertia sinuspersici]